MQVDKPCEKLCKCICGERPTHYSIGYGSTPYYVCCLKCGKQTNTYAGVGGHNQNIIDFWNKAVGPFWNGEIWEVAGKVGSACHERDWKEIVKGMKKHRYYKIRIRSSTR